MATFMSLDLGLRCGKHWNSLFIMDSDAARPRSFTDSCLEFVEFTGKLPKLRYSSAVVSYQHRAGIVLKAF